MLHAYERMDTSHRTASTNSLLTLAKKKKPLPPPSRRTLELNKASHGVRWCLEDRLGYRE